MLSVSLAAPSGRASPSGLVAVETVRRSASDMAVRRLHSFRCKRYRLDDLRIAGAAAKVARNCVSDLFRVEPFAALDERRGRHQETGRAVAALCGTAFRECLLYGMQLVVFRQSLDGTHAVALRLDAEHKTTEHRLVVNEHAARPAVAHFATVLGTRQLEIFPQDFEQRLVWSERALDILAVDVERKQCFRWRYTQAGNPPFFALNNRSADGPNYTKLGKRAQASAQGLAT